MKSFAIRPQSQDRRVGIYANRARIGVNPLAWRERAARCVRARDKARYEISLLPIKRGVYVAFELGRCFPRARNNDPRKSP